MQYTATYQSSIGKILLACDNIGLTGLWFYGQKFYADNLDSEHKGIEVPLFKDVKLWLDIYFSGQKPNFIPTLHMIGTQFQLSVWRILQQIPYGKTMTYGEIAQMIAKERGLKQMSAQAVGSAVGHNEISIIIPCHRVVGTNGSLTGYAGGIDKKVKLLTMEGINIKNFYIPTKGTAL